MKTKSTLGALALLICSAAGADSAGNAAIAGRDRSPAVMPGAETQALSLLGPGKIVAIAVGAAVAVAVVSDDDDGGGGGY